MKRKSFRHLNDKHLMRDLRLIGSKQVKRPLRHRPLVSMRAPKHLSRRRLCKWTRNLFCVSVTLYRHQFCAITDNMAATARSSNQFHFLLHTFFPVTNGTKTTACRRKHVTCPCAKHRRTGI